MLCAEGRTPSLPTAHSCPACHITSLAVTPERDAPLSPNLPLHALSALASLRVSHQVHPG